MTGIGISHKEWKEERKLEWHSLRYFGITMSIVSNIIDISKLAEQVSNTLKTLICTIKKSL